jgi:hypothetical protein
MRRNRRGRRVSPAAIRGALGVVAALALGIWLGVAVGLATRPRGTQPPGAPRQR